eukprot:1714536-Amphidinium_carterae.1
MADSYRKMLGYHVQAGDRTMAEYSWDCLSAPMRELSRVYTCTAIQNNTFMPDETRSGHLQSTEKPEQLVQNDDSETESARSASEREDEEQEWLREGVMGETSCGGVADGSEVSLFRHCARGTAHRHEA